MSEPISPYSSMIAKNAANTYNVRDEYKHLTLDEIQSTVVDATLGYSVMALNVEGDLNVGMMIRTASLLGANDFYVFGRKKIDNRSMVGADKYINLHKIHGLLGDGVTLDADAFEAFIVDSNFFPIFVEQGGIPVGSVDWNDVDKTLFMKDEVPLFIFGNEGTGIPTDFIDRLTDKLVISIPQRGALRSFNVGASTSIVLWDYTKRLL